MSNPLFGITRYISEDDDFIEPDDVDTKGRLEEIKRKIKNKSSVRKKRKHSKDFCLTNGTQIHGDNREVNVAEVIESESDTKITKSDTKITKSDTKITKSDTKITKSDTKITKSDTKITKYDTKTTESTIDKTSLLFSNLNKTSRSTLNRNIINVYKGPEWINSPKLIGTDLNEDSVPLDKVDFLDEETKLRLTRNGISVLFPVQFGVISRILEGHRLGLVGAMGGLRPTDICVSSPTGSGKTLAYCLPILSILRGRLVPRLRALIVLPTRDLAAQVARVVRLYQPPGLRSALLTGASSLPEEREELKGVDVVTATPGRLVEHLLAGMDVTHIRFLVIDEGDRLIGEGLQDWLTQLETRALANRPELSPRIGVELATRCFIPFQKLLFSATMCSDPEKLSDLNLFRPVLYAAKGRLNRRTSVEEKFAIPSTLSEKLVLSAASEKPATLLYLLRTLKANKVLCFTNSVTQTNKLFHFLRLSGVRCAQLSSAVERRSDREMALRRLRQGRLDAVVCTDSLARGMDLPGVDCVVSYDPPGSAKVYVHRVGRTARQGLCGTAVTVATGKECSDLQQRIKGLGRPKLETLPVDRDSDLWAEIYPIFKSAISKLPRIIKHSNSNKK